MTHEALEIRPLFEEFLRGKESDTISDLPQHPRPKPIITAQYEAGEGELSDPSFLSDSSQLPQHQQKSIDEPKVQPTLTTNGFSPPPQNSTLPWSTEVEAIASHLKQIRTTRTVEVQVEAVLDNKRVQISPTWTDLPVGAVAQLTRSRFDERNVSFLGHVNLDWQVLVGEELVSFCEYKKRVLLSSKGLALNSSGEVVAGGIPLRQTMPEAVYEMFLSGLLTELANFEIEIPHAPVVARPDKAQMELQARYGAKIKGLIHDLFKQRSLIPDGVSGTSLLRSPINLLQLAIERVELQKQNLFTSECET